MAPADLLQPLEGQREETLRILDGLDDGQLEAVFRESGWTVKQIFAHIARAELGEAFFIRSAGAGDMIHMSLEDRDKFNDEQAVDCEAWDRAQLRTELIDARESLREAFAGLDEDAVDLPIRWPEWQARTIRTSIPYMLEHEDAHLDQVRAAVGLRV